ncbi:MAG: hypothetical protein E2598_04410 [Sphingobium sp.]|nr:hypothetical protein [Sphingobium sp.]
MIDDDRDTAADINYQPNPQEKPNTITTGLPITNEEADLGNALRAIYRQTVDEEVPDEMLDLLSRLG